MRRDKIYEDLNFSADLSVEDWNAFIKLKFGKYFTEDAVFEEHKEILRTEIVNYIRVCTKAEYLALFDWSFDLFKECADSDRQKTIEILINSFYAVSETDMKWMTNVLTQPDSSNFSERDKINYYFKVIDETLEGAFKTRFRLLCKFVNFKLNHEIIDNSNFDFGKLIRDFPNQLKSHCILFLRDPIFSIATNQWRNIAAHKSFTINKDNIIIEYGKNNMKTLTISYSDFYKIVNWTQDIYRVIRLSQVLADLNYIKEIVAGLGGTTGIKIRFESSLLHLIHNIQIVGFKFVATRESNGVFSLFLKSKQGYDLRSSLIHASQFLDQLSCAIFGDEFVRDKFHRTKVHLVDDKMTVLASASVTIEIALKRAEGKITLDEYVRKVDFTL